MKSLQPFQIQKRFPDQKVSFNPRMSAEVATKYRFYNTIPANASWVAVPDMLMTGPLYWTLPIKGDQVSSVCISDIESCAPSMELNHQFILHW